MITLIESLATVNLLLMQTFLPKRRRSYTLAMSTTTTTKATQFPPITFSSAFFTFFPWPNKLGGNNGKKQAQSQPVTNETPSLPTITSIIAPKDSQDHSNSLLQQQQQQQISRLVPIPWDRIPSTATTTVTEQRKEWVQLSGHEDSFDMAGPGTIWKKTTIDCNEIQVYQDLARESISTMMPKMLRALEYKGDHFLELEDLLYNFKNASVMDIKMGSRTFLEEEVANQKLRPDLYDKMVKINPDALTVEEHASRSVTKLRYMQFREQLSSSSNLGFRIEGYKNGTELHKNQSLSKIKSEVDVAQVLRSFFNIDPHGSPINGQDEILATIIDKLKSLRKLFQESPFFKHHEIIGSSLLIIYNSQGAGVWMIDFAKTVPTGTTDQGKRVIDHRAQWQLGNHEDGYLFGLDNLIRILDGIRSNGTKPSG